MSAQTEPAIEKKSVIAAPNIDPFEGEETDIAAQISLPTEGGWGWVVVAASFVSNFILEGIFSTFGAIYLDMADDLKTDITLITLINSVAMALLFILGPLSSSLINRFGFRASTMSGAIIISSSLVCSYFATSYPAALLFYGIIPGFGGCLVYLSSGIVVGFYFERRRVLAMSIAGIGPSAGVMVMFQVNSYIVQIAGWRTVVLLQSGLIGMVFFIAMAYQPLTSITVSMTTEQPTRTVTFLPNVAAAAEGRKAAKAGISERLFSAVSTSHFPTAAAVVEGQSQISALPVKAGQSTVVSKLTLTAHSPKGGMSQRQLDNVKSIISKVQVSDKDKRTELTVFVEGPPPKKKGVCARLCSWESHIAESRPMYRDDALYQGDVEKLLVYDKNTAHIPVDQRTGLEYKMAVSRAVTLADLEERGGLFTTAVRRILATMLDPSLLKRFSFLLMCCSGLLLYLGAVIPFVFLPDRNKHEGIDPKHCSLFVSSIGFALVVGKILTAILGSKFNTVVLYISASLAAGIATLAFNFHFSIIYQYCCCLVFGVGLSMIISLRSIVLVELYGLDKLTNATGVFLLFQGCGMLVSTPMSSIIHRMFGYAVAFYEAGVFITLSGVILFPVKMLCSKENAKEAANNQTLPNSPETAGTTKKFSEPAANATPVDVNVPRRHLATLTEDLSPRPTHYVPPSKS